ncbi:hypothetical protein MTO96_011579 [Rhipicephalus appendiculatus]
MPRGHRPIWKEAATLTGQRGRKSRGPTRESTVSRDTGSQSRPATGDTLAEPSPRSIGDCRKITARAISGGTQMHRLTHSSAHPRAPQWEPAAGGQTSPRRLGASSRQR